MEKADGVKEGTEDNLFIAYKPTYTHTHTHLYVYIYIYKNSLFIVACAIYFIHIIAFIVHYYVVDLLTETGSNVLL